MGQIASLTKERKEELERMAREKAAELEKVKKTTPAQMWTSDLDSLESAIQELYEKEAEDQENAKSGKGSKRKAAGSSRRGSGKRGKDTEEEQANGEGGDAEDDEGSAIIDPMDNPFGDIARWTAGAIKTFNGPAKKKRRTN